MAIDSWLDAVPFRDFESDEVGALRALLDEVRLADGQVLYAAGDVATGLFILATGRLHRADPALLAANVPARQLLDSPGTLLSSGSLFRAFPHRHVVTAAGDASVLHLPRERFESAFGAGERWTFRLLDNLLLGLTDDIRTLNQGINTLLAPA